MPRLLGDGVWAALAHFSGEKASGNLILDRGVSNGVFFAIFFSCTVQCCTVLSCICKTISTDELKRWRIEK